MATFAFAFGALIIAITVAITGGRYGKLPDRVPIHFGIDGAVDGYGPRYAAWLLVIVQLIIAFIFTRQYLGGKPQGVLIAGDSLLAICLAAQMLIISAAVSGKKRISTIAFWIFFAAMVAVAAVAFH